MQVAQDEDGTGAARERAASVNPDEIARFSALAERWWDPQGPMRPLHRMNRLRVGWAQSRFASLPGLPQTPDLLDLGCGAGIAAEALALRGFQVTGLDASAEAIEAAEAHRLAQLASQPALASRLRYRTGSGETLRDEGQRFHLITALEVIEHVPDPVSFLRLLASLLRPGGGIVISTLNRSLRSLLAAKIGAEYVLGLLPRGTHEWRRFVTPAELGRHAAEAGLRVADLAGMTATPGGWRESRDTSINYVALLTDR